MALSVVFMGTPDFARASLQALLQSEHRVVGVVSQPDRPKGRGQQLQSPPVVELAREHGLPILQTEKTGTREFREWVKALKPDIAVVAAFGHILGPKALAVPRLGCINVHASLLPRWRGASPIHMAVLEGDERAGVSIMQMDPGMDTGGVFRMRGIALEPKETTSSLHDKLAGLGGELLIETLSQIEQGLIRAEPQPSVGITMAPLLKKTDGQLQWADSAYALERRVRALNPWPGTYSWLGDKLLRVLSVQEVVEVSHGEAPGTVLEAQRDRLVIACGEGALALGIVQLEGKKALDVRAFLSGFDVPVGLILGPNKAG